MYIEIHALTIVTHECGRTGRQIEEQRFATTYRVDVAQFAGLLRPLAEFIRSPEIPVPDLTNGWNGNGGRNASNHR